MTETLERVQPMTVLQVDPRLLLVDVNVRRAAALDAAFVDSIRDHGVLMPIVAVHADAGRLRVRYGQRRTLGAIEAGRDTVPVLVLDDEHDDAQRIVTQWHENEHRAGLTTADKVAAVEQLALLGLTAGDIVKRTRSRKADVDQALVAAGSKLAKKSAQRYEFLDLEQAAAVAEFDNEPDTVKALIATAKDDPGRFAHVLQRARDIRAEAAAIAKEHERLERAGVRILTQRPDLYSRTSTTMRVESLVDGNKKPLTTRGHAKCPGHAAFIAADWQGVQTTFYCLDWPANGHRERYGSGSSSSTSAAGKSDEAAKKERREVIANNKAWRSAETVRRLWLTEFLTRSAPPKGAAAYVAAELACWPYQLQNNVGGRHDLATQLLGLGADIRAGADRPLDAAIAKASDQRVQVITLALLLGSIEASTSTETWRRPDDTIMRYFAFLTANGYTLADVEQLAAMGPKSRRAR